MTFKHMSFKQMLGTSFVSAILYLSNSPVYSQATNFVEKGNFPLKNHLNQSELNSINSKKLIKWGGLLFGTEYNAIDGVGSNLSLDANATVKFTRIPRMDLPGFASNPTRTTGPNSRSCVACHSIPFPGGAGELHDMEIRDPFRSGDPNQYVQRNPLHLFGSGVLQLVAEQTTQELFKIRDLAVNLALKTGNPVEKKLVTKNGISYGKIKIAANGDVDYSEVVGITKDLILRPYTYKGSFLTFLRPLVSLGTDTQMGMPANEVFGENTDFDFDGHINEMTIGDITAMTLYIAALPRPVSQLELSRYIGGKHQLTKKQRWDIKQGKKLFSDVGCNSCHTPTLNIDTSVFKEPSAYPMHRFPVLPSGQDPVKVGLDPANPVVVDLAVNPAIGNKPNTRQCRSLASLFKKFNIKKNNELLQNCFLQYPLNELDGGLRLALYGDLKWHDMGPGLAENVDEAGTGKSIWKTRELWGVGNTGPWLHDGRATTLHEAIMWHGGEAENARDMYSNLATTDQKKLVRFLKNLVLYLPDQKTNVKNNDQEL